VTALVAAVFVASLVGSLHCAGMCGGLVAFYAGGAAGAGAVATGAAAAGGRRGAGGAWAAHAAYSLGRLIVYAAIGALAGTLGAALDGIGGTLAGVQRVAAVVAGLFIAAWGVYSLLIALGFAVPRLPVPAAVSRPVARGIRAVAGQPAALRGLVVGLLTGLLPCGWLWAFAATAAGSGSAARGALVMAVFWAGTLPVLVALGAGVQTLAGPLRRHVPAITAVALIVVGLFAVVTRGSMAEAAQRALTRPAAPVSAGSVPEGTPPCCAKDGDGSAR
jgi:hypothetical protein